MDPFNLFARGRRFLIRKLKHWAAWDWKEWWQGWRSCWEFKRLEVSEKTVLMVEPNSFHGEILPGFVEYFQRLGFRTVLLCRRENVVNCVFCRALESQLPKLLPMNPAAMRRCLKTNWHQRFNCLFVTSTCLAVPNGFFGLFFDYLGFDPQPWQQVFMVEHRFPNLLPFLENERVYARQIFFVKPPSKRSMAGKNVESTLLW